MSDTVFLDRDGTINVKAAKGDYVKGWDEFRFLPGAVDAVGQLRDAGYRIVIVTNQRGIARGLMTEEDLADIHRRMVEELGPVDGIYHCPHEEGECDCRKPKPGLLRRAAADDPGIDLERSVMIGDSHSDMEAGRAVGAQTIKIGSDSGSATSLKEAVLSLLERDG